MAVLKNVENKIKLVMIVSSLFLVGCVIVSLGSIIIAKGMVDEAHKKVYVLDGTVPILVKQTTQEKPSMWKPRATSRCSISSSSRWHLMTSISNTP